MLFVDVSLDQAHQQHVARRLIRSLVGFMFRQECMMTEPFERMATDATLIPTDWDALGARIVADAELAANTHVELIKRCLDQMIDANERDRLNDN